MATDRDTVVGEVVGLHADHGFPGDHAACDADLPLPRAVGAARDAGRDAGFLVRASEGFRGRALTTQGPSTTKYHQVPPSVTKPNY